MFKPNKESKAEKNMAKAMIFLIICVVIGVTLAAIGIIG